MGVFRESKNQKSGKFHELPRKSIHFVNPPSRVERVMDGREGGDRDGEREMVADREGGARAKPGNQLVVDKLDVLSKKVDSLGQKLTCKNEKIDELERKVNALDIQSDHHEQ